MAEEVNEEEVNGLFELLNNFLQTKDNYENADLELVPDEEDHRFGLNTLQVRYFSGFSNQSYPAIFGALLKKKVLVIKKIELSDPNTDLIDLIDHNMKPLFLNNQELDAVVLERVLQPVDIQRLKEVGRNQWKTSKALNENTVVYLEKVKYGGRRSRRLRRSVRRRSVRRRSRRRR